VIWLKEPRDFSFLRERQALVSHHTLNFDFVTHGAGSHELHEEGAYYCLDYTSVLALSVLLEVPCTPSLILDMCASPGGKTVGAYALFERGVGVISNEVISKRLPALISNIKRCGIHPSVVTSRDPSFFAEHFKESVSVVLVDAPCSGQSLVASKGAPSGAFHPAVVQGNVKRQRRIISLSSEVVAPGGYLVYMTCTFSERENEKIIEWFLQKNPLFRAIEVPHLRAYQSVKSEVYCYSFTPENGGGSGGFSALLRRDGDALPGRLTTESFLGVWRNDVSQAQALELREEKRYSRGDTTRKERKKGLQRSSDRGRGHA
jgi:16S rRNA C967 or C1407 C5-methylase (RsmB/RsmF family)